MKIKYTYKIYCSIWGSSHRGFFSNVDQVIPQGGIYFVFYSLNIQAGLLQDITGLLQDIAGLLQDITGLLQAYYRILQAYYRPITGYYCCCWSLIIFIWRTYILLSKLISFSFYFSVTYKTNLQPVEVFCDFWPTNDISSTICKHTKFNICKNNKH